MASYAKPVLVTTEWLADHLEDAGVVVAEVDENPDLYDEGHIPGAIKLHWRDDLQDPIERDLIEREAFEQPMSSRRSTSRRGSRPTPEARQERQSNA
ncbi:MAG: rhodanese-like domain-containing protein [Gaiellaceae bacterium]